MLWTLVVGQHSIQHLIPPPANLNVHLLAILLALGLARFRRRRLRWRFWLAAAAFLGELALIVPSWRFLATRLTRLITRIGIVAFSHEGSSFP